MAITKYITKYITGVYKYITGVYKYNYKADCVIMKVTARNIIKCSSSCVRFHQQKQLLQWCGNNLCIRSLLDTRSLETQFITLGRSTPYLTTIVDINSVNYNEKQHAEQPNVTKIYDFISSNNRKSIFVVEQLYLPNTHKHVIQVCMYVTKGINTNNTGINGNSNNLKIQRKSFRISQFPGYLPSDNIREIQLVTDIFQASLIYVISKTKNNQCNCICLLDMHKQKVIAMGFMPVFQSYSISQYQDGCQFSINGKNWLKKLKLQQKQQAFVITEEKLPKKLLALIAQNGVIKHYWMGLNKLLVATDQIIYILQNQPGSNYEILQTISTTTNQTSKCKILQILALTHCIIVFMDNMDIQVYVKESEESDRYILAESTQLRIVKQPEQDNHISNNLNSSANVNANVSNIMNANVNVDRQCENECKIVQIQVSKNKEQIIIVLSNGQYYYSRIEDIGLSSESNRFSFQKVAFKYYQPAAIANTGQYAGDMCAASGQNFCLLTTHNAVQIWDLQKIKAINRIQFVVFDDKAKGSIIQKCTLNPDGHSFCVALADRIKFYRILINKLKLYCEFQYKKCSLLQYSHGGQLIACVIGRSSNATLVIINTMKMKQICLFKLGFAPQQIVWNEYDDEVFVSGKNISMVHVFKISTKSKQKILQFRNPQNSGHSAVQFIRYDYVTNCLIVSISNGQVALVDREYKITKIHLRIQKFHYVYPVEGIYFATSKNGKLYYSTNLDFQKRFQLPLFMNVPFNLQYRKNCLIAYSTPENSITLSVQAPPTNNYLANKKQQISSVSLQSHTSQDIMLMQKSEIIRLLEKTKNLQSQLEQLTNVTAMKLEEQQKNYRQSLEQNCANFKLQIENIHKKYQQVQADSSKTDKYNQRLFEQLESGQIRSVNDLEKVYDTKIRLQKQKYLSLQQENMQQNLKYQKMIKQLETDYHRDIQKIRTQYTSKLSQHARHTEQEKHKNLEQKKKLQAKLIDVEQESQLVLFEMQNNKDTNIKNLITKNTKLEREYDALMIELHNTRQQYQEMKGMFEQSANKIKKNENNVMQNQNRVKLLEAQLSKRDGMIQQKNLTIQQQAHQIQQLQKSKHVLTFRTFQIRKTLQPKQQLIQKLKSELSKLDQQYKQENKKNYQMLQKFEKTQKILQNLRKQTNQLKLHSKSKQRLFQSLCYDIYSVINGVDPKQWNNSLVKIYQQYIKEQKFSSANNSKKNQLNNNNDTSQQINRHLIHVEQSLLQVSNGNQKMLKGRQKQVFRKMKQNAQLVYDLNIMRKKQNQYLNEIKQKNIEISRLRRQLRQTTQTSNQQKTTRANTANTGFTKRNVISRDQSSINHDQIDLSIRRQSDYLIPSELRKNQKGRVLSAHRTMIWRDDSRKQKTKISDMAKQLESAKNTMRRQDRMIEELNQRLLGLPELE